MAKRKPRSKSPRRVTLPQERAPSAAPATTTRLVDLSVQYHYVVKDLRQIAIIAAILIGGLVGLSFFLR